MPRPRLRKRLRFKPNVYYYKPRGVPVSQIEEVILSGEEMEALKLKDCDGLEQSKAAEEMNTSQSTFQRILSSARSKVADAIVTGKALKIEKI